MIAIKHRIAAKEDAAKLHFQRSKKQISSIELVYHPFLIFRYDLEAKSLLGKKVGESSLIMSDMCTGIPINICSDAKIISNCSEDISGMIAGSEPIQTSGSVWKRKKSAQKEFVIEDLADSRCEVLPCTLSGEEAAKKAMWALRYDLMMNNGPFRYRDLKITPRQGGKMVYFPYWLLYFKKRSGEYDFEVIDAVNCQKEGGQMKKAIKAAFFEMSKREKSKNCQ